MIMEVPATIDQASKPPFGGGSRTNDDGNLDGCAAALL
jgi:hypothetical protein